MITMVLAISLLNQGCAWINLNVAGVAGDSLLVVIELPTYKSGARGEDVAVNISGPYMVGGKSQWNISDWVKII